MRSWKGASRVRAGSFGQAGGPGLCRRPESMGICTLACVCVIIPRGVSIVGVKARATLSVIASIAQRRAAIASFHYLCVQ
jgi:hypothetical protein